jgi:hypothetical protein
MRILGVDPGIHGGLAIMDDDMLIAAIDIPTIGTGAKERVDVRAIRTWILEHRPKHAVLERAQAMPNQGASSGFKFGRAVGAIEAAIVLCGVPSEIVEPTAWKRFWRLPAKEKAFGLRSSCFVAAPTANKYAPAAVPAMSGRPRC